MKASPELWDTVEANNKTPWALSLEKKIRKKNAQKTVHKSVTVSCLFCRDRATRKTISVRYPTELCQVSKMECWKGGAMHSIHASFFIFLVQAKNVWGIVFLMFLSRKFFWNPTPFSQKKMLLTPWDGWVNLIILQLKPILVSMLPWSYCWLQPCTKYNLWNLTKT